MAPDPNLDKDDSDVEIGSTDSSSSDSDSSSDEDEEKRIRVKQKMEEFRQQRRNEFSSKMKAMDFSDLKSLENWYERFELYCLTNKDITAANRTAHFFTLIKDKVRASFIYGVVS